MQKSYAIGIDVGGSSLKCGLVDNTGQLVREFLVSLQGATTENEVIALIVSAIQQCAADHVVTGVGIGFPGVVDDNVVIGGADNLPGFENLPLAKIIHAQTGLRTVVDNDANMMGFGEWMYGAAKGMEDAVFLTVGTGIGGAVIIDGKLFGGYKNRGTELGHIIIQQDGEPCSCGGKGCFEVYASTTALVQNYQSITSNAVEPINGKTIAAAYLQGNTEALYVFELHFNAMAAGIASLINIFSPQKVVIGGGISESGNFYISKISERAKQLVMPAASANTEIVAAALGNKAGLLGCAAKVFSSIHI